MGFRFNYADYGFDDDLNYNQDPQLVHFFHLQLQFLLMPAEMLQRLAWLYVDSGLYCRNRFSSKVLGIAFRDHRVNPILEQEHKCLATHLAVQMSGLE